MSLLHMIHWESGGHKNDCPQMETKYSFFFFPVPSRMSLLDVSLTVTDMSYPTFQFSPENVNFIIDNKYCQ